MEKAENNDKEKREDKRGFSGVVRSLLLIFVLMFVLAGAVLLSIDHWIVPFISYVCDITPQSGYKVHVSLSKYMLTLEDFHAMTTAGECDIGKLQVTIGRNTSACGRGFAKSFMIEKLEVSESHFKPKFSEPEEVHDARNNRELVEAILKRFELASLPTVPVREIRCRNCNIHWQSGDVPIDLGMEELGGYYRPDYSEDRIGIRSILTFALGSDVKSLTGKCSITAEDDESKAGALKITMETLEQPRAMTEGRQESLPELNIHASLYGLSKNGAHFTIHVNSGAPIVLEAIPVELRGVDTELSGVFQISQSELQIFCQTDTKLDRCTQAGSELDLSLTADMRFRIAFDLASGEVTMDSLSGEVREKHGADFNIVQNGTVRFALTDDGSYNFEPLPSSLHIFTSNPVDLEPFGTLLPIPAGGHRFSGEYLIKLDPEAEKIYGETALSFEAKKEDLPTFEATISFETDGITKVQSFRVPKSELQCTLRAKTLLNADLSGKCDFNAFDLVGSVQYRPYEVWKTLGYDLEPLAKTLKNFTLSDVLHTAKGKVYFNIPELSSSWDLISSVDGLGFTDESGVKVSMTLNGSGECRYEREEGQWYFSGDWQCVSGEDISIDVSCNTTDTGVIYGRASFTHAKHHFMKQILEKFFDETELMDKMALKEMNFDCDYIWEWEKVYPTINNTKLTLLFEEEERIEIKDFAINPAESAYNILQGDFSLEIHELPLQYCNAFLPRSGVVSFDGGVVNGKFKYTHPLDAESFHLEGELTGRDVSSNLDERNRYFKRIEFRCGCDYSLKDGEIQLPTFTLDLYNMKDERIALFTGEGKISTSDDTADFNCTEVRYGPDILNYIRYAAQNTFCFDEFDAEGHFNYHIRDHYRSHHIEGEIEFNRVVFTSSDPGKYHFPQMHGKVAGAFSWDNTDGCLYGDASIELMDEAGKKIASGSYLHTPDRGGLPFVTSDALDLAFVLSYFNYNIPANPNLQKDGEEYEPPHFHDISIQFDLSGLYAGNEYHGASQFIMEFGGSTMELKDMIFSGAFSGDANASFDFRKQKPAYTLHPHFRDVQIEKLMSFCSECGFHVNLDGLSGIIADVEGDISGQGFSHASFRDNLKLKLDVQTGRIEYESEAANKEKNIFTVFLEIPFVLVPRFIDLLPIDTLKNILRLATGGSFLDALTGNKALVFKNGDIALSLQEGVLSIENMRLNGEGLDSVTAYGTVNLLTDEQLNVEYTCQFGELLVPLYLYGNYKDPEMNESKSIVHFWSENTANLLMLVPNIILNKDDNIIQRTIQSSDTIEE